MNKPLPKPLLIACPILCLLAGTVWGVSNITSEGGKVRTRAEQLEATAEKGDANSMRELAFLYRDGDTGRPSDKVKALIWADLAETFAAPGDKKQAADLRHKIAQKLSDLEREQAQKEIDSIQSRISNATGKK
jgi:hypothetical protein